MWEFSVYFEKPLLPYFNNLKKQLKDNCKNYINCVSIGIKDNNYVFMVALPEDCYLQFEQIIKQNIAEIICVYYKPYHILKSLKNFDINCSDNIILLNILTSYEYAQDVYEISNKLKLTNKLFLQSYVSFALKEYLKKWRDISALINQNSLFLLDEAIRKELIKFLMAGLNSQAEILLLNMQNNCVCVTDKNNNKLPLKTIFYAKNKHDNLLFTIINKFPKTLQIKNSKMFDVELLDCLYQLFGEKVKIIS